MISVSVDTSGGEPPPLPQGTVRSLIQATLGENNITAARIQVVFAADEYLHRLKQRFTGRDHYTDVLAFQLEEPGEPLEGEIYISRERALENSRRYGESHRRELMRLVVHGSLHLAGYRDDTIEEREQMRAMEDRFLDSADG